jgi:ribosomal-protein-alanine N-acetyltransferase
MNTDPKIGTFENLGPESVREVMEIERACFAYHWTEEQFLLGLERGAYFIVGWRCHGVLVAYLAFSMIADEMEILNLAVLPEFRRRGIARRLLDAVLHISRRRGMKKGFLDVKESNTPAISLYEDYGFVQVGRRKRYYPDTKEDALLYVLDFD